LPAAGGKLGGGGQDLFVVRALAVDLFVFINLVVRRRTALRSGQRNKRVDFSKRPAGTQI
jgi:hypothetical protein